MIFRIVLSSNTAFSIYNFRLGLMKKLKEIGFDVIAVSPYDKYAKKIEKEGFQFFQVKNLDRKGKNPLKDIKLMFEYYNIFKKIEPDLVINYTIKPNIYGSLACGILGIKSISVITGLGYIFVKGGPLKFLVKTLYKLALRKNKFVIFLNKEDMNELLTLIEKDKAVLIGSSGVNLRYFSKYSCENLEKPKKRNFTFLFVGRFLKDKGIYELIEAGKRLYHEGYLFEIWLLGDIDKGNPASLTENEITELSKLPFIRVFSFAEDVRPYLCVSDCVVLPSYREGMPRVLLEAMAMENPIITTDAPGCRDVCIDGENGFLVKPKDVESLYTAMKKMIEIPYEKRVSMGVAGRKIVQESFSEDIIIKRYIELIKEVINS